MKEVEYLRLIYYAKFCWQNQRLCLSFKDIYHKKLFLDMKVSFGLLKVKVDFGNMTSKNLKEIGDNFLFFLSKQPFYLSSKIYKQRNGNKFLNNIHCYQNMVHHHQECIERNLKWSIHAFQILFENLPFVGLQMKLEQ